jgi:chemotaxis protein CheY-P-specific phosphatase CheC
MTMVELNEDIRDGLQEIANVAVGQTADKIARSFSTFVKMPIPQVHMLESADIMMTLGVIESEERVTAVTQAFYSNGINGEALLLFSDASMQQLSELMHHDGVPDDQQQAELVLEIASLLNGSCIQGICGQLDLIVLLKHPELFGQHESLAELLRKDRLPWDRTLAIELNYAFEGYDITCDLVVLFNEDSLASLFEKLEFLVY